MKRKIEKLTEHKPKTHLLPTCHQQYQHPIHPKQGKYNAERPKIQYKSETQKLDLAIEAETALTLLPPPASRPDEIPNSTKY